MILPLIPGHRKRISGEQHDTVQLVFHRQQRIYGNRLNRFDSIFQKDFWEYTPDNLAIVMLSTTDLIFGAQLEGTRSAAQLVTLTNSGPVTLTISSITASGDFLQKNNCGSSVPAGESCTIKVAFKPSAKGVRTGTVTITDDAADSPQTIALTGTGTVVQVSPLALDFGDQIVGTTSDPQTATITNISNEVLRIFGVGISGPNFGDFAATTTCGSKLAAGGSCTIDVTFTPGARGDRHASLKIVDDGGASPQAVPLRGTGVSQIGLNHEPVATTCWALWWLRSCPSSVASMILGAADCIGVIALIASDFAKSRANSGRSISFACAICWVHPSRFERASTVPAGMPMLRAISRRPMPLA